MGLERRKTVRSLSAVRVKEKELKKPVYSTRGPKLTDL